MSQKNDETTGAIMVIAFIGVVAWVAFLIMYALLAFLALILTIVAFWGWNRPITIGGVTTEPHEARIFVWRGVMGAALFPMFVGFASMLFDVPINSDYVIHFFIAGYTAGSVGIEILLFSNGHYDAPAASSPSSQQLPAAPPRPIAPRQPEPFRFASWDDEEEGR